VQLHKGVDRILMELHTETKCVTVCAKVHVVCVCAYGHVVTARHNTIATVLGRVVLCLTFQPLTHSRCGAVCADGSKRMLRTPVAHRIPTMRKNA